MPGSLHVRQINPWTINVSLSVKYSIKDNIKNIKWNRKKIISTEINITDFQDPPGSGNWNSYEPILSNCAITNQWTTCAKEAVYSGPSVANSVADNPNARFRTPNIVSSTCTSYYLDNIQFYQIN